MSGFQPNSFQSSSFQTGGAGGATCFDPLYFDPAAFDTCSSPATTETHSGLLLNPPKGWRPIDPPDDPDELWLLGLTDLETH